MQARYRRLVFPGRFQPPHQGHLSAIKFALDIADELIVVVGSAQDSYSLKNPLTAGERIGLLRKILEREVGPDYCRRVYVVPVMDIEMNKVWVQYLRMLLGDFDGVVSGNPLVLQLFKDMGLAAIRQPMFNREECSGTRIRELVLKGSDKWKECVPDYIIPDLERLGFEERIRQLASEG
ncbi:MAG: nicotinamide-nucleotide adenylyltransferase [Acidilobus sp.]